MLMWWRATVVARFPCGLPSCSCGRLPLWWIGWLVACHRGCLLSTGALAPPGGVGMREVFLVRRCMVPTLEHILGGVCDIVGAMDLLMETIFPSPGPSVT